MGLPGEGGGRGHPAGRRLGAAQPATRHWLSLFSKQMPFFPPQVEKEGKKSVALQLGAAPPGATRLRHLGVQGGGEGSTDPRSRRAAESREPSYC